MNKYTHYISKLAYDILARSIYIVGTEDDEFESIQMMCCFQIQFNAELGNSIRILGQLG